ncbi:MAG: hypothetical protein FK734_21430 [Asgard group archaeon]|nr:hypothetical protein [Asgard group archaeon]
MATLYDIFINVIASIIFFIMGYISNKLINVLTISIGLKRCWKDFLDASTMIVVPTLPKGYKEIAPEFAINDLKIGSLIDAKLAKITKNVTIHEVKFALDKIVDQNIILVGSPLTNNLTKEIFDDVTLPVDFVDNAIKFKDTIYQTIYDKENHVKEDYGIIINHKNYYNPYRRMLIIAGNTDFSTYNTAKVVTIHKFLRKLRKMKLIKDFIAVYKTTIVDGVIMDPELADYQFLLD